MCVPPCLDYNLMSFRFVVRDPCSAADINHKGESTMGTPKPKGAPRPRQRYGIAEWFGHDFLRMAPGERSYLALQQQLPKRQREHQTCPFRSTGEANSPCTKSGGMCSVRPYTETVTDQGRIISLQGPETIVTICPYRVREGGMIYRWVSEVILGTDEPLVVAEVGFLDAVPIEGETYSKGSKVGRIDNILMVPGGHLEKWCALEVQAVYLSGESVSNEWKSIAEHANTTLPFPVMNHRPDFRSSGPKRLMPQLQTKVPSLRRWGKKMGVVIDEAFFRSLGPMDSIDHVSNSDIVWFVVGYEESAEGIRLVRRSARKTTLERAVEGLTGGVPVSLEEFERRIAEKPPLTIAQATTKIQEATEEI